MISSLVAALWFIQVTRQKQFDKILLTAFVARAPEEFQHHELLHGCRHLNFSASMSSNTGYPLTGKEALPTGCTATLILSRAKLKQKTIKNNSHSQHGLLTTSPHTHTLGQPVLLQLQTSQCPSARLGNQTASAQAPESSTQETGLFQ